jgi:hypothetical protein
MVSVGISAIPVPPGAAATSTGAAPAYWQLRLVEQPEAPTSQAPLPPAPAADPEALPIPTFRLLTDEALLERCGAPADASVTKGDVAVVPPGSQATASSSSAPLAPAPLTRVATDLQAVIAARPDGPVEIRLSPEELGQVRLRLWHEGDAIRVIVQVERPETLDLMRRHTDALLQDLRTSGFSGGSLSFEGWGGTQGSAGRVPEPAAELGPAEVSAAAYPETPHRSGPTDGLDLRL